MGVAVAAAAAPAPSPAGKKVQMIIGFGSGGLNAANYIYKVA